MTESIDFQAVCEQLQQENEALRLANLKLRSRPAINWYDAYMVVRDFASDHYVGLLIALMVVYYGASMGYAIYRLVRSNRHV